MKIVGSILHHTNVLDLMITVRSTDHVHYCLKVFHVSIKLKVLLFFERSGENCLH